MYVHQYYDFKDVIFHQNKRYLIIISDVMSDILEL